MDDFGIAPSRAPPKKCDPVEYHGMRFTAPLEKMGYVVAQSINTGEVLWQIKVYDVTYLENLERDIQERYITDLEIKDGNLLVTSEGDAKYIVDLEARTVKPM